MKKLSVLLLASAIVCAFTGQAVASPFTAQEVAPLFSTQAVASPFRTEAVASSYIRQAVASPFIRQAVASPLDFLFGKNEHAEKEFFAMDTVMSVSVNGKNAEKAAEAVADEVNRLDKLLSTGSSDSEVSLINENGGGTLGPDGCALMKKALGLYEDSEGLFDISIYPVMELWGFASGELHISSEVSSGVGDGDSGDTSDEIRASEQLSEGSVGDAGDTSDEIRVSEQLSEGNVEDTDDTLDRFRVPTAEEIDEALKLVDASSIRFDEETGEVFFDMEGMKIDFGGIAKGYTSSRMMDILREQGIESALVNLGGNVQALGTKPDGSKWRVGVQDPGDDSGLLGILEIADLAVITSGGYERYFEEDGQVYHHIIDPRTGFPANTGLTSVTIVSSDGTLADGLSTFLFIAGEEQAEAYWRSHAEKFDMILAKEDGTLLVTEGIEDAFSTEYEYEVIAL